MNIFDEILEKSNISKEELEEKISEFKKKNPDLNNEIASFFVAKELGVEIDDSKLVITPLNLLDENSKNVNILVVIDSIFPKKEYNSNNKTGTLQNAYVTDNTSRLLLTFWNCSEELNQGDVILVTNVYTNTFKNKLKLNTSKFSTIKIKDKTEIVRTYNEKELYELQDKDTNLSVTGTIREKWDLREFERNGESKNVLRFVISNKGFKKNCVAWGDSAKKINELDNNTKIKIENCYAKLNRGQIEIHLNDYSKITELEKNVPEYVAKLKKLSELDFYEVSEIHTKIKSVLNSRYIRICKVCNNPMMKIDDKYFCAVCNRETESFAKSSLNVVIEDESGNSQAILTKKILKDFLKCDEEELEQKLNNTEFEGMSLDCVGYLRRTNKNESEFFVDYLL